MGLGFRLVRVRITGQNGCTVQIMAERPDGTFTIEDCEAVSVDVSPVLDVEDIIRSAYHLEVSSPGVDRPLVRVDDFHRAQGHVAKIEFSQALTDSEGTSRRRFRGLIDSVAETSVSLLSDDPGKPASISIPFDAIEDAKLVMTDALLEATQAQYDALNKNSNETAVNDNEDGTAH